MDRKAMIATAVSTFIAVVVTGAIGWATGVWSQGSAALERDQIESIAREVVLREMETDAGVTVAQALTQINSALVEIKATGSINREDIRDIRVAVQALAGSE